MTVVAAIPIFNESRTIGMVVEAVKRHVDAILVIDDGSTDDGATLAEVAGAEVLRHPSNRGKGRAIASAIRWTRSHPEIDWLVLLDGDGQHDPGDIEILVNAAIEGRLDICVGSRFIGDSNVPFYRVLGLHVLSATAALGSGVYLSDSQSGFRILSRAAIDQLDLREGGFSVEAEMQFHAGRMSLRVGEVPISIRYSGPARRSPVVHGVSVLLRTLSLTARHRPARLLLMWLLPVTLVRVSRSRGRTQAEGSVA